MRRASLLGASVVVLVACGDNKRAHDDGASSGGTAVATATPGDGAASTAPGSDAITGAAGADAAGDPKAMGSEARPEHTAWRLVDNRHAAHRSVDGGDLVIDARDAGFARYTRFGVPVQRWQLGASIDGERAALADKLAAIEVPIIPEQPAPTQVTARVNAADKQQSLLIRVNGNKARKQRLAQVALEPGWQTVALPIEKGWIEPGENVIDFETAGKSKKKIAFSWIRVGAVKPAADVDPLAAATFDTKADAIELAEGAALTWYVTIPEGAHLVADVAAPCHVVVGARAGDASFVGGLLGAGQRRVDMSSIAGKVVRLSLATRDCPRARIANARITLHGPPPKRLPDAEPPKYVILWIIDALRADKVSIFTPGARAQTPNFEELAKSSVVFRQFYVQGNESQASHASMWTSLYPAVHALRIAGKPGVWKLDRKADVLGEELAKAGLFTTGVTGNGFVTADRGYARGFREFRNMMRELGGVNGVIYGEKILDAALAGLDKHRHDPTFLFMGTIDTHGPWIARKPWIDIYSPGPYDGPFQRHGTMKELGIRRGRMGCSIVPPQQDIERLRAIYDSAISYHDQQLGRLVKQLKSWGIWDQTMLVITADHGEEFFEDMRCGHGGSLRDSLVRVPLLIRDPSRFPGGTIVHEGAEGVDILPSMLESLGRPLFAGAQGESLAPLAQGIGRGWPRPSYASMYEYAHAMRIGRWKARVGNTGVPLLVDMVDDPDEQKDLAKVRPIERRMITDNLGLFLALRKQWKKSAWGVVTNISAAGAAALDEVAVP
jgi:arylsulfatase A-like enzyme